MEGERREGTRKKGMGKGGKGRGMMDKPAVYAPLSEILDPPLYACSRCSDNQSCRSSPVFIPSPLAGVSKSNLTSTKLQHRSQKHKQQLKSSISSAIAETTPQQTDRATSRRF